MLAYDSALVSAVLAVESTGLVAEGEVAFSTSPGVIKLAFADAAQLAGSGDLVNIVFRLNSDSPYGLTAPLTLSDAHLSDITGQDLETALQQTITRVNGQVHTGSQVYLPLVILR
jgi:hypothetical protein